MLGLASSSPQKRVSPAYVRHFRNAVALAMRHRTALTLFIAPLLLLGGLDLARCLWRGPAADTFLGLSLVASRISFLAALVAGSALVLTTMWRVQWLRAHPACAVAWVAFVIFTANGMAFSSSDTGPASLLPFRILRQHTLRFDESFHDVAGFTRNRAGEVISRYPIATPLLVTPLYAWAAAGDYPEDLMAVRHLAKVVAALLTAVAVALMAMVFWKMAGASSVFAALALVSYALGTAVLPVHSHGLWQHTGTAAALSLALYALVVCDPRRARTWLVFGAAIGFAVCARPPLVVVVPGLVLAALARETSGIRTIEGRERLRRVALIAISGGAFALALGTYDFVQFGSPLRTGYASEAAQFTTPFLTGFVGSLASPGRGLFVFCPILLFCFVGWRAAQPDQRVRTWLALSLASYACLMAKWWAWDGAWSAGPRMLSDLLPLFAFVAMCGVRATLAQPRWRQLALAAATYGAALHLLLTFVMPPAFAREMTWDLQRSAWSIHAYPPLGYVEGGWLWLKGR